MARLIILGAGISGHTAATYARKWLPKEHEIIVVTPNQDWNYIPSNTWVSMGKMKKKEVLVALKPVYEKIGIIYKQAKAISIHPNGNYLEDKNFITIKYTSIDREGEIEKITYDYLINATGPKFNYGATPGLGKGTHIGKHTVSICTANEAENAYAKLTNIITKAKKGYRQEILVGTSHGTCGCQAAALMYLLNVENQCIQAGVRDMIDLTWITNESFLGDFGVGGIHMNKGKEVVSSKVFTEDLLQQKNIFSIVGAHVYKVESKTIKYELLDGTKHEKKFDFAMLLPQFIGTGLSVIDKTGKNITSNIFADNGFMLVDAKYQNDNYKSWKASDWPETYQNQIYKNIFACGTAFAPPHPISKPMMSPNGTYITPGAPRSGMASYIIGKTVSKSICNIILDKKNHMLQKSSMSKIGSVCFVTSKLGIRLGESATLTIFPIVPNFDKYPKFGRDLNHAYGEFTLSGHWMKYILHHIMRYKASLKPGWSYIL